MLRNRLGNASVLYATAAAIAADKHENDKKAESNKVWSDEAIRKRCLKLAIKRSTTLVKQKMIEIGMPGIAVGVSVNGKNVWSKGFGYADIENNVPCTEKTVMRIASISKSLTVAAVAKLLEDGMISLDDPVQKYLPDFPKKYHENKEVSISMKMLLSHTSGIRHYEKKATDDFESKDTSNKDKKSVEEFDNREYYSTKPYKNITEALDMFKDDLLFHKPGEKFLYTTHGFTLVSAIVEMASGEDFILHMKKMFHKLGMHNTVPEYATDIVYHRSGQYERNENGRLVNVPYVDNSYKWAGGGFISNVLDLVQFGNAILYSFHSSTESLPGFLKCDTVEKMWSPIVKYETKNGRVETNEHYGLGWFVRPWSQELGFGNIHDFEVSHTGGAIGGSSILYILPDHFDATKRSSLLSGGADTKELLHSITLPSGVVIAILTNLQGVNLTELARMLAKEFRTVPLDEIAQGFALGTSSMSTD